jgi:hypothetical protein
MLKCIICLQAVTEIITNETARALDILVKQHTKVHNEIHQNHLALDYLLASEGGVGGKFKLSNCCLQIDDKEKVIENIVGRLRKLAHLPIQTWRGWNPNDLFRGWFSALGQDPDRGSDYCLSSMFNSALLGSLGIAVSQDHYGGHYKKENSFPCNDAVEIQILSQDDEL